MLTVPPTLAYLLAPFTDPVGELTRRGFLGGLVAATALSACAAEGGSGTGGDTAATRSVTDMSDREVEVPTVPQRVVFLNELELAPQATTLGFVPYAVAASDRRFVDRLASLGGPQADLSSVRYAGPSDEFDLEAIAALRPDLIFVDGFDPEQVERVAALAPTLALTPRALPDPLAAQRLVADVLGLTEVLEERIAAYESRLEQLSDAVDVAWTEMTYNILDQFSPEGGNYVYDLADESAWWPSVQVLEALGASPVPSILEAAGAEGYLEVSAELLPEYDADLVFMATPDDRAIDATVAELMVETKSARSDQLFQVDATVWSYANGIQGRFDVIDDLEELLAGRALVVDQFGG